MTRLLVALVIFASIGCKEESQDDPPGNIVTKSLVLYHRDDGLICLNPNGNPVSKVYCWTDGTQPQVLFTASGDPYVTIHYWQGGVCAVSVSAQDCVGVKDTSAGTWAEAVTCAVTGKTYHCPSGNLTFD